MKIGKLELTEERLVIAASLAAAFIILTAYLFFYMPLMRRIRVRYSECKSFEKKARECRDIIKSAGDNYEKRVLTKESGAHRALDGLTKHGRAKGVNFVSISPKRIRRTRDPRYKVLPVTMEIESTYKELGVFLGSLDELKDGLIKVESFTTVPDPEDASGLVTKLDAGIYLSGRDDKE
jgi:Tfp pilus assembly protein PilO